MQTFYIVRLAWPFGSRDLHLPARPRHQHATPALLWRNFVRQVGWRPLHGAQTQGGPQPC